MRARRSRLLLVVALALAVGGCSADDGGGATGAATTAPAGVPFTAVELPAGAAPVTLTAAGEALLIGVRRDGRPVVPGLLRHAPDGTLGEVPVHAASPYGLQATWQSVAVAGDRIVAIGGERGGAHGNVRWSVWTGSAAGLTEYTQGFSVFGGYGAGDLLAAVPSPAGSMLVGTWESAKVGFDVAVWTTADDGVVWTRQSSAGTAQESSRDALGFPMAATGLGRGILVAGWQLATESGGRQQPAVWRSADGNTGWTRAPLPDGGQRGAAVAVRCWDGGCGAAGWVDGTLAVWRSTGDTWARLGGAPSISVGDEDRMVAPVQAGGALVQVVTDGGRVRIARADGDRWTVRDATGPTGTVTAAATVGDALYVLAGPDDDHQRLWRADLAAIH